MSAASSRRSDSALCSSSSCSLRTSASTSSFCDETETYSPVAMENAPAASPASPVSTMRCGEPPEAFAPAPTPAISETLVTRPSMAPNTAGRSQPPETSLCWCPSASCCSLISTDMVGFPRVGPGARWLAHRWRGAELPGPQAGSNPPASHHYSPFPQPRPATARSFAVSVLVSSRTRFAAAAWLHSPNVVTLILLRLPGMPPSGAGSAQRQTPGLRWGPDRKATS